MRQHPEILALGYSEAGMFLREVERNRVGAVISIHGGQESGVEWMGRRLDLGFDDVEVAEEGDMVGNYRVREYLRREAENGRRLVAPTLEDARGIVAFAREVQGMEGIVLCHCGGGVSRSPAAAILCLAAWTEAGQEQVVVDYVRMVRACAMPHEGLVRMGDQVLGRGGRLVEAVRQRRE